MKALIKISPLLLTLTIGFSSCKSGKLNYHNGTYYSAQEMARIKKEERQKRRADKKNNIELENSAGRLSDISNSSRKNSISKKSKKGTTKKTNQEIEKVIKTARSYKGTPYKYGGTTRIGLDCSGLICNSFKAINIDLPRTSEEQSRIGQTVQINNMREGDLLFFGETKSSKNISHVGMVTDVKSKEEILFIHSSTKLGVIEDNLFSDHWKARLIKGVRPEFWK